jgi:hypothetical protein
MESYSFNHTNSNGVMTTLSFTVQNEGTHISTFHSMCRKFAIALGYAEGSVEEYFGSEDDEAFMEFTKQ